MSNETTQKRSLSVSLGAAFLMATSAIGPGFLTQTSQFTAKYLSSFAFVIVCVIIMDMIAQTNVWSIVGVSGLRGQEIANKVLPGLGYLLVVLVVLGGLAFNIGNVGGVSLGFNAMIGIPEKAGVIIGGAFSTLVTSLTDNLISPILGILGKVNFDAMMWDVFGDGKLVFKYGAFITSVINFLIMALVLFLIVKGMNRLMDLGKHKEEAPAEPEAPAAPTQEELLADILAELKKQNGEKTA